MFRNGVSRLVAAAVLPAMAWAVLLVPASGTAQAGQWVLKGTYLGTVTERDSSTYVYFRGGTIPRGQSYGLFAVSGQRQTWGNSQGCTEWVTLRAGTTHVTVDRTRADEGRRLLFHCYQYWWVWQP